MSVNTLDFYWLVRRTGKNGYFEYLISDGVRISWSNYPSISCLIHDDFKIVAYKLSDRLCAELIKVKVTMEEQPCQTK